jgi:hypothetical protein
MPKGGWAHEWARPPVSLRAGWRLMPLLAVALCGVWLALDISLVTHVWPSPTFLACLPPCLTLPLPRAQSPGDARRRRPGGTQRAAVEW